MYEKGDIVDKEAETSEESNKTLSVDPVDVITARLDRVDQRCVRNLVC